MASSTITVKSSRDPNYPRVDRAENFASSEPNTNENRYVARINLIPLADSIIFSQKQLRFAPAQEIRVGRLSASRNQKESKSDNGVFDCDVMSREHAILKEDGGKIMIKDLKSTHGTFINNTRLGDGLQVSEWKVLNHNDVITFGHNVRRNQNLYKHLSARVSYTEENINTNSIINNTPTLSDDIKGTEASSNEVKNLGGLLNQKDNVSKNQINTEPASVVKQSINVNQENSTHADNINDASPPPGIDDKVDVGSPEKPVTPAITPDHHPASPIAETSINKDEDEVDKNTPPPLDIKIREDIPLQIVQVSNQIHISHKEVNSDTNGEGPSILDQKLEETAVVKLTTSRKRKYEDMEDEKNETEGTELGCRLAEKEGSASKRIRLEVLLSAAVGFTIGATGVFLYYLSGTPSL